LLKLQCLHNRGFDADTTPPKTNMTTHTDTPNTVDQHTQAHCGQQPSVLTERVASVVGKRPHTMVMASAAVSFSPAMSRCFPRVMPTTLGRMNELPSSGVRPMSEKGYLVSHARQIAGEHTSHSVQSQQRAFFGAVGNLGSEGRVRWLTSQHKTDTVQQSRAEHNAQARDATPLVTDTHSVHAAHRNHALVDAITTSW